MHKLIQGILELKLSQVTPPFFLTIVAEIDLYTMYDKTFKRENFCGFHDILNHEVSLIIKRSWYHESLPILSNCESFPP